MKRTIDLILASVGLILLAPALILIGLWVKLDSPGPAIYRQVRVGRGNRDFEIRKFRTMKADVSGGSALTISGDIRITRAGSFLRTAKLDELPQLLNVLEGTMSLVGPRPEVREFVNHWPEPSRNIVLSVRPGITDPAALIFRREAELLPGVGNAESHYIEQIIPLKLGMYVDYVHNQSASRDILLILRTVREVLFR